MNMRYIIYNNSSSYDCGKDYSQTSENVRNVNFLEEKEQRFNQKRIQEENKELQRQKQIQLEKEQQDKLRQQKLELQIEKQLQQREYLKSREGLLYLFETNFSDFDEVIKINIPQEITVFNKRIFERSGMNGRFSMANKQFYLNLYKNLDDEQASHTNQNTEKSINQNLIQIDQKELQRQQQIKLEQEYLEKLRLLELAQEVVSYNERVCNINNNNLRKRYFTQNNLSNNLNYQQNSLNTLYVDFQKITQKMAQDKY